MMGCGIAHFGRRGFDSRGHWNPLAPRVQTHGDKILDQILSVWVVSRPLWPKWAVPHPIISQNMRFNKRKKLWTIPLSLHSPALQAYTQKVAVSEVQTPSIFRSARTSYSKYLQFPSVHKNSLFFFRSIPLIQVVDLPSPIWSSCGFFQNVRLWAVLLLCKS